MANKVTGWKQYKGNPDPSSKVDVLGRGKAGPSKDALGRVTTVKGTRRSD